MSVVGVVCGQNRKFSYFSPCGGEFCDRHFRMDGGGCHFCYMCLPLYETRSKYYKSLLKLACCGGFLILILVAGLLLFSFSEEIGLTESEGIVFNNDNLKNPTTPYFVNENTGR